MSRKPSNHHHISSIIDGYQRFRIGVRLSFGYVSVSVKIRVKFQIGIISFKVNVPVE